ncbi:MAG: hypothetical protein ACOCZK_01545 [Planctomycetota bacterium]
MLTLTVIPLCLVIVGCTDDESDSDAALPARDSTQESAAFTQAHLAATVAVRDALTEDGQTTEAFGATAVPGALPLALGRPGCCEATATSFDYRDEVSLDIDLDMLDGNGSDRYPNASGQLHLDATATSNTNLSGASGEVRYSATVTATGPVTATDPISGWTATWPTGTSLSLNVTITWTRSALAVWELTAATASNMSPHDVTVSKGDMTLDGRVLEFTQQTSITRSSDGTEVTLTDVQLEAMRQVSWTDAAGASHMVRWDVQGLDAIFVTLDGTTFGPFTIFEVMARLGATV